MNPTMIRSEEIHEDRRDDRRYPIELALRYKVVARNRNLLEGAGLTVNMSSGGVLFRGVQGLPAGSFVELSINWPVLLEDRLPLTLLVVGRIVRCENSQVAVKTSRYEFVTRPTRVAPVNIENTYIA